MTVEHSGYKRRFISTIEDSLRGFEIRRVRQIYAQFVSMHGAINSKSVDPIKYPRFYAFLLIRE